MIHLIPIPDTFPYKEQLLKMKSQTIVIQDFADFTYLQTPWAKTSKLQENVQQFVDEWRV